MVIVYSYFDEKEQCEKFKRCQAFTNARYNRETRTLEAWVSKIGIPHNVIIVHNILSIDFM